MKVKIAMKTTTKPGKELDMILAEPQNLAHRTRTGIQETVLLLLG
jgi:hypothetical protein